MKAVIQRVTKASVHVDGTMQGSINNGSLVLLGVEKNDSITEADYILEKIINLRIFNDEQKKMNRSLIDIQGSLLIVSQFTLLGDCRKGRRPSFNNAADPETGKEIYEYIINKAENLGFHVETGKFGAMMEVSLVNDGPVTILLDSRKCDGQRVPVKSS